MYEIWSLGHKPFEMFTNNEVTYIHVYMYNNYLYTYILTGHESH